MANNFKILHKRSTSTSTPSLDFGEIAVRYANGNEALLFKNEGGTVVEVYPGKLTVEQTSGSSTTNVMSQDAVTKAITDAMKVTADNVDFSEYYKKTETSSKTEIDTALLGKSDTSHTHSNYITRADYNPASKKIEFYNGSTKLNDLDASAFIKDGMVNNVTVVGDHLQITFNADSGKDVINIPISDIFNASNYYTTGNTYTRTEIDAKLNTKSNTSHTHSIYATTADTYTKEEVDVFLNNKSEIGHTHNNYLPKSSVLQVTGSSDSSVMSQKAISDAIDDAMTTAINTAVGRVDLGGYYRKTQTSSSTEISTALAGKSDTSHTHTEYATTANTYTKSEVNGLLDEKSNTSHTHSNYIDSANLVQISGTSETAVMSQKAVSEAIAAAVSDAAIDGDVDLTNYYKKTETSSSTQISTALDEKSNTGHTHDDYATTANTYTKGEVNGLLDGKSSTSHTHTEYVATTSITQTTGTSDTAIMSQDAVTRAITDATSDINLDGYYTKVEVDGKLGGKLDTSSITQDLGSSETLIMSQYAVTKAINDKISSGGNVNLNDYYTKSDVDGFLANKSNTGHTHDEYVTKTSITQTTGTSDTAIMSQNAVSEAITAATANINLTDYYKKSETSSRTEIETALNDKSNTGHTHDEYVATTSVTQTTGNSTTDLMSQKAISDAITAATANIDLDEYYKKSETSSSTQISTALDEKSNTSHTHAEYATTANTYTKGEVDDKLDGKLDTESIAQGTGSSEILVMSQKAVTEAINEIVKGDGEVNLNDYYTKTDVNGFLANKANLEHEHTVNDISGVIDLGEYE